MKQESSVSVLSDARSLKRKRVSFESTQTHYFEQPWHSEEKSQRWYTNEELSNCRQEAKQALEALQAAQGRLELVDSRFCLRGIEKFGDLMTKIRTQKIVKQSILQQQRQRKRDTKDGKKDDCIPTCPETLAVLSRYLTQPSRDIAHQYALMNATEALDYIASTQQSEFETPRKDPQEQDPESLKETHALWISPLPPSSTSHPITLFSPSITTSRTRRLVSEDEASISRTSNNKRARVRT